MCHNLDVFIKAIPLEVYMFVHVHVMMFLIYFIYRLCLHQQTDVELMQKLKNNREKLDVSSSFLYRLSNEELFG